MEAEQAFNWCRAASQATLKREPDLHPMAWAFMSDGVPVCCLPNPDDPNPDDEVWKQEFVQFFRHFAKQGARCLIMMSEAWAYSVPVDDLSKTVGGKLLWKGDERPRTRSEVFIVQFANRTGYESRAWLLEVDEKGVKSFGEEYLPMREASKLGSGEKSCRWFDDLPWPPMEA